MTQGKWTRSEIASGDWISVHTEHFGSFHGEVRAVHPEGISLRTEPLSATFIPWWTVVEVEASNPRGDI